MRFFNNVNQSFRIFRQILSRNQNKNSSADWSVGNLRGKTIKTKVITYLLILEFPFLTLHLIASHEADSLTGFICDFFLESRNVQAHGFVRHDSSAILLHDHLLVVVEVGNTRSQRGWTSGTFGCLAKGYHWSLKTKTRL